LRQVEIEPGRFAHASGALWLADSRTALLADVHLGYGWAQRRRGQLGPVADANTRDKLFRLIDELNPANIVFLGDIVHAPRPAVQERLLIENTIRDAATRAELILVLGNHDRGFLRDFPDLPIHVAHSWEVDSLIAVHGDKPGSLASDQQLVLGHLHPAIGVRDAAGASQRIPAFLVHSRAYVLPAFSPFATGFNVKVALPWELRKLFGKEDVDVVAATGRRVVCLGPLERLRLHNRE
jgi:uncharacterized protein